MLRQLLESGKLMQYLIDNSLHTFSCNAWSEGQDCCLENDRIIEVLLALLVEETRDG